MSTFSALTPAPAATHPAPEPRVRRPWVAFSYLAMAVTLPAADWGA